MLKECNADYKIASYQGSPPPEPDGQQLRARLTDLDVSIAEIPRLKAFDRAFHAG